MKPITAFLLVAFFVSSLFGGERTLGVWVKEPSFGGAKGEAILALSEKEPPSQKQVFTAQSREHFKSYTPPAPKEETKIEEPVEITIEEIPYSPPTKRSYLFEYSAAAAIIGTTVGALLTHDKSFNTPSSPNVTLPTLPPLEEPSLPAKAETLQFIVHYHCGSPEGESTIFITLPNMTLYERFGLTNGSNPSSIITNLSSGTYYINLFIGSPAECFTVDVIVDGTTVVSNASFEGSYPFIEYQYRLP